MAMKFLNIGIAVRDREQGLRTYREFFDWEPTERYDEPLPVGLRASTVRVEDLILHVFEPLPGQQMVRKFLDTRGEGIYRLAFEVDDLPKVLARLKAKGVPCQEYTIHDGKTQIAFPHPKYTNGVMFELVRHEGRTRD